MSGPSRVQISRLPTGVPGLDEVLGGGIPEFSFNLIAGEPGSGKTTLAHQIVFANATAERPALYFTVLGEPPLKMLRYQQQMSFFDPDKVDGALRFVNLSQETVEGGLGKVLESIVREVTAANPTLVVVDSFRTVVRAAETATGEMSLQGFAQQLAMYLTGWLATTFLVGEYLENEVRDNPVFTVADGILWLHQSVERNSVVRKLQVVKMRGQAQVPGLHVFRMTRDGLQVFPRTVKRQEGPRGTTPGRHLSTGAPGLDEMLGGGIREGDAALVAGPSGSGKTVLATQFIAEGAKRGEPGVIAVFEESPQDYMNRARGLGFDLETLVGEGKLKVIYLRPLDLSVDEIFLEIRDSVERLGARRVVIDSLSGFEIALAPPFKEDFRESLYRLVTGLTGVGVTVLMTVEVTESFSELHFTPHTVSFLADEILLMRYVEMEGQLRKVMTVVKVRGGDHSKDLRAYEITSRGLVVGEAMADYRGIITGIPSPREVARRPLYPGLTDQETRVLQALLDARETPAEALVARTGLGRPTLTAVLDRLLALNYVLKSVEGEQTVYRPSARPLGT